MIDSLPSDDPTPQKRRTARIVQAVPITVTGVDALGQPFKERTTTVIVNCHGCKYQSKHYVPKNSSVTLEIPRPEPGSNPRSAVGRVVWVQRPRAVRELFQIGIEFEASGNVWGFAFPPPIGSRAVKIPRRPAPASTPPVGDMKLSVEQPAAPPEQVSASHSQPISAPSISPVPGGAPAPVSASVAPVASTTATGSDNKIHLMPVSQAPQEPAAEGNRQIARMMAEAKDSIEKSARREAQSAINDEMIVVRQLLDAQLHETIERAIKLSLERVSESEARKMVQQAERRTTEIVDEARKSQEAVSGQLDARVLQIVEQSVNHVAQQAAQQAAAQAITQNLRDTVEHAVTQAINEREAALPSLQILSSPEAARQQLEQWTKNLEESVQEVRNRAAVQSQADADAARQRWREEMEASLSLTAHRLANSLAETSQNAIARAGDDFVARGADLRSSLEEALARTQSALNETRGQLEELVSTHNDRIALKADQIIAERTAQMEPALQSSAQKIIDGFSSELQAKVAPSMDQARGVLSDLQHVRELAERLQESLHEQIHQVSEKAIAESLDRVRHETANYSGELEKLCKATLSKAEAELEQRRSEVQHETYEALLKASDWYQKKTQTTLQSALEKTVERAADTLRDRAAEVSSLVASELDHHRRTYLEHSQAQIEESAKDVVDRQRARLNEASDIANATFSDRVHHQSAESLRRLEDASNQALEKARSDMEYNREDSLGQFQKTLDERMTQAVDQARTFLQSQLAAMMEQWETGRQAQQRQWADQLKTSSDELIEQYKIRLGNASNSWLLASATTLGQNSQAVLEALAKSAEKRVKETFADVLSGMGDTLKERLHGLSGNYGPAGEAPPHEK